MHDTEHDDPDRLYVAAARIKKAVRAHLKKTHSEALALQTVVKSLGRHKGTTIPIDSSCVEVRT